MSGMECDSWSFQGQVMAATVSSSVLGQQLPRPLRPSHYVPRFQFQGLLCMRAEARREGTGSTHLRAPLCLQNVSVIRTGFQATRNLSQTPYFTKKMRT